MPATSKQPTRTSVQDHLLHKATRVPTWSCSGWGLPCPFCCQFGGALLPHLFTLPAYPFLESGGLFFCGTFLGLPPPGTGILILMEPGLSSPFAKQKQQPSGHLTRPDYTLAMLAWSSERHDTASPVSTLHHPRAAASVGRFGLVIGFGFFSAQPCVFFVGFVGLQDCQLIG